MSKFILCTMWCLKNSLSYCLICEQTVDYILNLLALFQQAYVSIVMIPFLHVNTILYAIIF